MGGQPGPSGDSGRDDKLEGGQACALLCMMPYVDRGGLIEH